MGLLGVVVACVFALFVMLVLAFMSVVGLALGCVVTLVVVVLLFGGGYVSVVLCGVVDSYVGYIGDVVRGDGVVDGVCVADNYVCMVGDVCTVVVVVLIICVIVVTNVVSCVIAGAGCVAWCGDGVSMRGVVAVVAECVMYGVRLACVWCR